MDASKILSLETGGEHMGLKDALSGLADMYKSEVERKDSAQYADIYKDKKDEIIFG